MNAYSEDFRKKIVEALHRGMGKSEAVYVFGVSFSSVKHYTNMTEEGRPIAPKKGPGSRPKVDEGARRLLEVDLETRPSATVPKVRVPAEGSRREGERFESHRDAQAYGVEPKKDGWEQGVPWTLEAVS